MEHLGVFYLPSFSRPQMPISSLFSSPAAPPPPPHPGLGERNRWSFLEKPPKCLLHLPSPLPLPLGASALRLPWQLSRADLLLPAGHRYSTWALLGRLVWLWSLFSLCQWDTLGMCFVEFRCFCGVEGSKPGHPHHIPHTLSPGLLSRLQGPGSLSCPWPTVFAPMGSPEWCLTKNPQPFLSTAHQQPGLQGGLGVKSICLGLGSGLTSHLTLRDEKKTSGKIPICC